MRQLAPSVVLGAQLQARSGTLQELLLEGGCALRHHAAHQREVSGPRPKTSTLHRHLLRRIICERVLNLVNQVHYLVIFLVAAVQWRRLLRLAQLRKLLLQ